MKTKKIQIKNLKPGMKIKTLDSQQQIVYKTVTNVWETNVVNKDQVRLEFKNGSVLNCSVNHPIMVLGVSGFEQKLPKDLTTQDRVLTENGFTNLLVADFEQNNPNKYIDITVEEEHTFFASNSSLGDMILTHNSQGGLRNASCTVTFPIWHYQFEDLVTLKNNQGTEENRVRQMDYSVVVSGFFWRRFKNKADITLFDPHEVPDLYEAYYRNSEEFEKLYLRYEQDRTKKKKVLPAEEVFKNGILKERTDTGRIYLVNIDNVINQGSFDTTIDPIYQSNLCLTGDTKIEIMRLNGKIETISLQSFVEQFELGGMYGVKVKSSNINTGEITWNIVSNAAKTATVTELIEIEDETGKVIRCTADHLIYTKNRGYVRAGELIETDELCVEI